MSKGAQGIAMWCEYLSVEQEYFELNPLTVFLSEDGIVYRVARE